LQRLISVDVNDKSLMSKEINEVTGIVRLFTSPNKGMQPAEGIIRAVTIIANEEYEREIETTTVNPWESYALGPSDFFVHKLGYCNISY